jgi:hypothetical protein
MFNTSSAVGLPTCQIWKACLERQKSYSPDTICYGRTDQFDLEVKVQGQMSPTMVRDTSSGGGLPTCKICKACLERQKGYSPETICYGRTDGQTGHYRASATKWRDPNNWHNVNSILHPSYWSAWSWAFVILNLNDSKLKQLPIYDAYNLWDEFK